MSNQIVVSTLAACLLMGAVPAPPDPEMSFSDPTSITNRFAPFRTGAVKIFRGRAKGARTATVETHLEQTRVFIYDGQPVECCVLEEKDFVRGTLVEISTHYVAQDDAGNVRYFGEVSTEYEEGAPVSVESDSWLVGGPTEPSDPQEILAADSPAMYMPVEPQLGDVFDQQQIPENSELLTVVAADLKVRVPAGKFSQAIKIREESDDDEEDDDDGPEFVWVVPGVGAVKEKASDSRGQLIATSLIEESVEGGGL